MRQQQGRPLLTLRSSFEIYTVLSRHPVRVALLFLVPMAFLPELRAIGRFLSGAEGTPAILLSTLLLFTVLLLLPLLLAALDCRKVTYDFHEDHMSFTESFILRDRIRIPYRSVTGLACRQNAVQKLRGLADLVLYTEPADPRTGNRRRRCQVIPDLRQAKREMQAVEGILNDWKVRHEKNSGNRGGKPPRSLDS